MQELLKMTLFKSICAKIITKKHFMRDSGLVMILTACYNYTT